MKNVFAHCDSPLPVPAGQGTYRIKGEFYRQLELTRQHIETKRPGVLDGLLERAGLLDFVKQQFLASVLYDLMPLPRIVMCMADALERDVRELTRKMGTNAIEAQLQGTYAVLFSRLTTANVHQRFPPLLEHLYDHAPSIMEARTHGAYLLRRGVPLGLAEWWNLVSVPFLQVPLERNGARGFTAQTKIIEREVKGGVPLGDCEWTLTWS